MFNAIWFYAAKRRRLLRDGRRRTHRARDLEDVRAGSVDLPGSHRARGDRSRPWAAIAFILFALFWVIESSVFGRDRSPGDVRP